MADKTINDLTAATTLAAGDLFEIENTGNNSRKITAANVRTYMKAGFRGCLASSAGQTGVNYSAGADVPLAAADDYDTDSIHDPVTNNTRLTTPSGVTKVRLVGCVSISNVTANSDTYISILKNGGFSYTGYPATIVDTSSTVPRGMISSPVLTVVGGTDYFTLNLTCADSSIDVTAGQTWFAMEILE